MESCSPRDVRCVVAIPSTMAIPTQLSLHRNMSSPLLQTPSRMLIHQGTFSASTSPRSPSVLRTVPRLQTEMLNHLPQVRLERAITNRSSVPSSCAVPQRSSQSLSPQRLSAGVPLYSPSTSPPPTTRPASAYGPTPAPVFASPPSPQDRIPKASSTFQCSQIRNCLASFASPEMPMRMMAVLNPVGQPTMQQLQKSLPFSASTHDASFGSIDQAAQLETRFREVVEKHIEKIQHALEQQIVNLSAQLQHMGDALSTSAKRDSEAIEVVCKDLEILRVQHQASLKDLSVQLESSLHESEQRQVEHMNEASRQFAQVVSVHRSKLLDLETAMEFSVATNTSISANDNSSVAVVLARVYEVEKSLRDTLARAEDKISSIDLQPKITAARVDGLSREVRKCLKNAQNLEDELDFRVNAVQGDVQRLEHQLHKFNDACQSSNAHVDDRASQVSNVTTQKESNQLDISRLKTTVHFLQDKARMWEQNMKDFASEVWLELEAEHQEQSRGFSELSACLNAKISELCNRISIQEDAQSNVKKAISFLDVLGAHDDSSLNSLTATPNFGLSSFSDVRSSIAQQSFEGRLSMGSDFMSKSSSGRSQNIGSPNFDTPAIVRNTSSTGYQISELVWHNEDRNLDISPGEGTEEESPFELEKFLDNHAHCAGQVGMHSEGEDADEEDGGDAELKNSPLTSPSRREECSWAFINSANSKHGSSRKPISSVLTATRHNELICGRKLSRQ